MQCLKSDILKHALCGKDDTCVILNKINKIVEQKVTTKYICIFSCMVTTPVIRNPESNETATSPATTQNSWGKGTSTPNGFQKARMMTSGTASHQMIFKRPECCKWPNYFVDSYCKWTELLLDSQHKTKFPQYEIWNLQISVNTSSGMQAD